jgi:membrane protein
MWGTITKTFREFVDDECPRLAASLAYYTFFALPALLVVIVSIGGFVVNNREGVEDRLRAHFEETIGQEGAAELTDILKNASDPKRSRAGWIVGSVMLLVGATGALGELQTALNRAWGVEPDPKQGGVRGFVIKRLLSLAFLLGIAVLLIASVVLSGLLAAFSHWIDAHPNAFVSSQTLGWLHTGVSLVIFTILIAAVFRFFPDAEIDWSDVWAGAIVTTLLFWLGQWALSLYLTFSKPTSAYGAAGSLALVLLWMYYSAMILFLGAEFTEVLALRRGKTIVPIRGARLEDSKSSDLIASR